MYATYPEQAEMSESEYGWSFGHVFANLNSEVLVESSLSVPSRRPLSSIQYVSKLVSGLRADPIVAVIHGEGNADLDNGRY